MTGEQIFIAIGYILVGFVATNLILNESGFLDGFNLPLKVFVRVWFVFFWFPVMVLICLVGIIFLMLKIILS